MTVYDLDVTDALLSTTRSVRKRLDLKRPVARETITRCIELSTQAPTGSNQQNWRWVVVTDAKLRARLAEIYREGASEYLSPSNTKSVAAGDAQTARVLDSARHLLDVFNDVPVHVLPCIEVEQRPADNSVPAWASLMGSIFPALWSFQLALRARGLGSVLTTLHLGLERETAALLDIPENVMQVGLLPVAYTVGTDFKPAKRKPVAEIIHWDRW